MDLKLFNRLMLPLGILAMAIGLFAAFSNGQTANNGRLISYNGNEYTVFTADPAKHQITLHWKSADGQIYSSINNVLKALKGQKVLMVTNAGMYTTKQAPVGLYIENGKKLIGLNTSDCDGNFCLKPNGIFYIDKDGPHVASTSTFVKQTTNKTLNYATQSGPMLVIDGKLHPAFNATSTSKYVRSGVGIDSLGRAVFAISSQPVNFHTFGTLFKDVFGCQNALYLDGAISLMYIPSLREDKGGKFGPQISVTEQQ